MTGLAGLLIVFGLLLFSVHERTQRIQKKHRGRQRTEQELPAQGSPLAESITQTVGIAGGIYISILTTINFLRLDAPETYDFWGVSLDPIAITALAITILQPFAVSVRDKFLR
jgi:hypothetical protein